MQFASRRGTPSKLNKIKLFINVTFCFRGKLGQILNRFSKFPYWMSKFLSQ